jgi:septal ring factor EnvC (AmiA/AmiB activator)
VAWVAAASLAVAGATASAAQQPTPAPVSPAPAAPQDAAARIRSQRDELDRIRKERTDLEDKMRTLQGTVHDLSEERRNLDRQADATEAAMRSLDRQLLAIGASVEETTGELVLAQDELVLKRAILRRRLNDIYKRGPLFSMQVMFAAQSFGELVSRYKYLHLLTLRDRALVTRVEALHTRISGQRTQLVKLQDEMALSREEKAEEEVRLRRLEEERSVRLRTAEKQAKQTAARLAQIEKDEARVGALVAALEAARKKAEARPNAPAPVSSTIKTSDFGKLDWPVDGTILYRFGRVVNPNNTATRWNGIGIAALQGSPVRAVAAGEVVAAEPIGTYGPTVIVQHGGGDYSVYGSLATVDVKKGATITKGQVVGTVGATDPDLPSHLHFEIRPKGHAMDPLVWLRNRQ